MADLLRDSPDWLRWTYPRLYACLVRYLPSFWALLYYTLDHWWMFRTVQLVRQRWNWLMARRFLDWVRSKQPDVIVVTHFFPADVVAAAKRRGWLSARLIVVVTDLFPHRFWLVPEANAVVVGSHQTQAVCLRRGIQHDRLHLLGIPVRAGFHAPEERTVVVHKLGLEPSRLTLLIVGGGMGVGPIKELTKRFAALEATRPNHLQLLVVCGHNRRLQAHLERLRKASAMPIRIFGFVETIAELMQGSDVMVTKAGGLTVMEALALGLPMIFIGTIPGQERFNAHYVASQGAGVIARGLEDAIHAVLRLFDDPSQRKAMQAKALALGRPHAAQELVERLIIPYVRG